MSQKGSSFENMRLSKETSSRTLRDSDSLAHLNNGKYVANRQERRRINILRQEYRAPLNDVERHLEHIKQPDEHVTKRLKGDQSIINKIGDRGYKDSTVGTIRQSMQDIAGTKIVVSSIERKQEVYDQLSEQYEDRVLSLDRYDLNPKNGYYGINMTVEDKGHPVEIQIKTKNDEDYANEIHPPTHNKELDLYKGPHSKEPEVRQYVKELGEYYHAKDLGESRPKPSLPISGR